MLIFMVAALQVAVFNSPPLPPGPPPPPPFTRKIEKSARVIGARVNQEFKRCGDAQTNSNGRYVEAMGTPAHSAQWKKASVAMANALRLCRRLRQSLRQQKDFLIGVAENGIKHDADLAAQQIDGASFELAGVEQYFATEVPRYRELLTVGWGNPHCVERADGFMPPSSVCPKGLVGSFVAVTPVPIELGPAWAQFTRAAAGRLIRTEVEVGTLGYDSARKRLDFWLRRSIVRGVQHNTEVTWADTRRCTAARPLLASMRNIPVPKFAPIGSSKGPPVILDGIGYSLRTYSDEGTLTAETNLGTPLAAWIEEALEVLDSCWSKATPHRAT